MIKYHGYYLTKPKIYQERKNYSPVFYISAYMFLNDSEVLYINNYIKSKDDAKFQKSDFQKSDLFNFEILENEICIYRYITPDWKSDFFLEFVSENIIRFKDSKEKLFFVDWNDN